MLFGERAMGIEQGAEFIDRGTGGRDGIRVDALPYRTTLRFRVC